MNNFDNSISLVDAGNSLFSNSNPGFPGTKYGYLNVLDRLKDNFLSKSEKYDRFMSCFVQFPEIYPDSGYDITSVDVVRQLHVIDNTHGQAVLDMYNSLLDWLYEYGSEIDQDHQACTITTSDGKMFVFKIAIVYHHSSSPTILPQTIYVGTEWNGYMQTIMEADFTGSFPRIADLGFEEVRVNSAVMSVDGQATSFFDILADLKENSELNELYYQACQYKDNSNEYISAIESKTANSSDCVKQQANLFINAFSNSGVFGVVTLFKDLFSDMSNVSENADGLIDLTDNNKLMPAEYITGILSTVVTVVASAISAIIAIANPVLGMISMAIVGLYNKFLNFKYDYDNATTAAIYDDGNLLCTPFALNQWRSNQNILGNLSPLDSDNYNVAWMVFNTSKNNLPCIIDKGFEWAIVSNNGTTTNFETHVDLRDRVSAVMQFLRSAVTEESTSSTAPFYYKYSLDTTYTSAFYDSLQENITDLSVVNSEENGLLSASDDYHMRLVVACNLLIAMIRWNQYGFASTAHIRVWLHSYATPFPGDSYAVYNETSENWVNIGTGSFDTNDDRNAAYRMAQLLHCLCAIAFNREYNFDYVLSWSNLIQMCNAFKNAQLNCVFGDGNYFFGFERPYGDEFYHYCYSGNHFDSSLHYCISIPKYNRQTFWSHVLAASIAAAAISATAAVVAFKVRSWSMRKATERTAKIEKAWNDYTSDPTDNNLKTYRRLVTKNNVCSFLFGGTKYSRSGYWCSSDSNTASAVKSSLLSKLRNNEAAVKTTGAEDIMDAISSSAENIIKKITG